MKIKLHPQFEKSYKKRISFDTKKVKRVAERLKLFEEDPTNPILKDHALIGERSRLRAFSVTGDIRIVYQPVSSDSVIMLDIGSHNQVY